MAFKTPAIDRGLELLKRRLERDRCSADPVPESNPWARGRQTRESRSPPPAPPLPPQLPQPFQQNSSSRYAGLANLARIQAAQPPDQIPTPPLPKAAAAAAVPASSPKRGSTTTKAQAPRLGKPATLRPLIKKHRDACIKRLGKASLAELIFRRKTQARAFLAWFLSTRPESAPTRHS